MGFSDVDQCPDILICGAVNLAARTEDKPAVPSAVVDKILAVVGHLV